MAEVGLDPDEIAGTLVFSRPMLTDLGRFRATVGRFRANLVNIGLNLVDPAPDGPAPAKCGTLSTAFVPNSTEGDPSWAMMGLHSERSRGGNAIGATWRHPWLALGQIRKNQVDLFLCLLFFLVVPKLCLSVSCSVGPSGVEVRQATSPRIHTGSSGSRGDITISQHIRSYPHLGYHIVFVLVE